MFARIARLAAAFLLAAAGCNTTQPTSGPTGLPTPFEPPASIPDGPVIDVPLIATVSVSVSDVRRDLEKRIRELAGYAEQYHRYHGPVPADAALKQTCPLCPRAWRFNADGSRTFPADFPSNMDLEVRVWMPPTPGPPTGPSSPMPAPDDDLGPIPADDDPVPTRNADLPPGPPPLVIPTPRKEQR